MGIITAINLQKNNPNRCSIFVDGKFALGVDKEIVEEAALEVGREVKEEELKKIMDKEELNKARAYTLKLLSYRERTGWEIKDRMRRKGYEDKLIEEALKYLEIHNLVNDKRFARIWTEARIRKGYGKLRVYSELREKRIDREVIEEALGKLYSGVDEVQMALNLIKSKRFSSLKKGRSAVRKICGFLRRRGFSFETINRAMELLAETS